MRITCRHEAGGIQIVVFKHSVTYYKHKYINLASDYGVIWKN